MLNPSRAPRYFCKLKLWDAVGIGGHTEGNIPLGWDFQGLPWKSSGQALTSGSAFPRAEVALSGMALSEWDSSLSQEGSYPPQHLAMSISVAPSLGAVESPGGWGL